MKETSASMATKPTATFIRLFRKHELLGKTYIASYFINKSKWFDLEVHVTEKYGLKFNQEP